MKVPHDFAGFVRNGSNKEMLFDLIQQSIEEDRANPEDRTVYFSNKKNMHNDQRRPSDSSSKLKFRPRRS